MSFPSAFPASRLPDPMDAPGLRWGVLGTGWIAEKFTGSVRRNTRQQVVAVGSRSVASAKEFAGRVGIGQAHGSYADLVADPRSTSSTSPPAQLPPPARPARAGRR